ncbi:MAG TPA: PBP1A family penicillin-binding protein [Patescibacteria group bacterium]|nr:PBP1A family penicillin-binding protein [Patescibacteria group bacterium]
MMRLVLRVLFFFLTILIVFEKLILMMFTTIHAFIHKTTLSITTTTTIFRRRVNRLFFPVKKMAHHVKKRKKPVFSLPFRAKIKYFFLGIIFSCLFLLPPFLFLIFIQDLPTPEQLMFRQIPQTTKIFDRNGILLAEFYAQQNRTLIKLSEVPKHLQQATLAIEDKNFYNHPGFDLTAILRAFQQNISNNNIQGGSTITQQLIKSSMLTPERSVSRKLKELILAFWAERIYTKPQILEMYFNQIPYGGTAWGIQAASETYFNKPVTELSLAESAFLAGLTAAPTTYSPYGSDPTRWKNRQKEVLKKMVELHYISQKEADKAATEELYFRNQRIALHAPHFVEYVKQQLINRYGLATVERGGLHVRTTLDLTIQEEAERIVEEEVANAAALNLSNGAALVTDPKNGDILAMVGSHDFFDPNGGNFNVTISRRQPGSSIKVVTYAAALQNGFTAASHIDDTPVSYPLANGTLYSPVNYDGRFHGRVTLRFALANSLNITAVKTLNAIGIDKMVALAKDMGIRSFGDPNNYGLSLTLGAAEVTMLDMARVNGVLANQGRLVEINPITKVTDVKGTVLEEKTNIQTGVQVLDSGIAFIISDILSDNQARSAAFGPNSVLEIKNHTVSVKTGTTDSKRDNWTNGYTDNYVVIVWVGNNDNSPMSQELASGITGAAPIWHQIMEGLLTKNPETKQQKPTTVIQKYCLGRMEYFTQGSENSINCGRRPSPSSFFLNTPVSPTNIPFQR